MPRVRFMRNQTLYVAIMMGFLGVAAVEPVRAASGAIKAVLVSSTDGACATDSYNTSCASGICICLTYLGTISGTVGTGAAEIDATEDAGLEISPGCIPILAAVFISTNRDPAETLGIAGAGCVVPSNTLNSRLIGGYSVENSAIGAIGWGTFSGTSFGATGKLIAHYQGH
jgi:hypothetical protein